MCVPLFFGGDVYVRIGSAHRVFKIKDYDHLICLLALFGVLWFSFSSARKRQPQKISLAPHRALVDKAIAAFSPEQRKLVGAARVEPLIELTKLTKPDGGVEGVCRRAQLMLKVRCDGWSAEPESANPCVRLTE